MMKLIESANSPQSARLYWNVNIHVTIATAQIIDPIPEKITSAKRIEGSLINKKEGIYFREF